MLNVRGRLFWWLIFLAQLVPLVYIVSTAIWGDLGAEPAKALVEYLGETALVFLFVTLSVTPLKRFKFFSWALRFRRMFGLYVFFYACLHLLAYGALLVDWLNFIEDLYKRLYVTMGFAAFLILLALAVTSPKSMVRKLGKKWKSLHRWVYVAVLLVVIHVWWQTRSDYTEAVIYLAIALVLLFERRSYLKSLLVRA